MATTFQPDLITANLPAEVDQTEDGMSIKDIMRIINLKYLDLAVDKTFNAHTADWNLCVFKKAFVLLDHRVLTYEELNDIRMAFCAYEHQDLKGMEINENTIIRCLKMCGRIIAPLKMHHRIKHMSQMFDEEGRIQLYEFLDLILWTELYDSHKPYEPIVTNAKIKDSSVYQIEDFHHIIQHYDERLAQYLNELYLNEEWSFGKEEFSKQKLPNELPVHRDFRLKNMKQTKKHYRYLKNHVSKSQQTVHITSTGHIRPRPLTAPNLEKYEQSEKSSIYTSHSQHKLSVADMVRDYIQNPASRLVRSASPRMKRTDFSKPKHAGVSTQLCYDPVKPAVTRKDKLEREHDLQNLKFHISTLDNIYEQRLQEDIQEQLPKYVPKPKVTEPPKPKPKKINPALLPDHINRLAYAPYRPFPNPSHAQNCDARFRGWHKVKTTKGPHHVLTTSAFSDNPNAKLQGKLYNDYCKTVKTVKGDSVIRKSTQHDIKTEINRPPTPAEHVAHTTEQTKPQETEQLFQVPKTPKSPGKPPIGALETIREGKEAQKQSASPTCLKSASPTRQLSASSTRKRSGSPHSHSAGTSSNRTYSFHDFKLYTEEYEKPQQKIADARKLNSSETAETQVVIHKPSELLTNSGNRRYSQVTGDAIAKEIVEQVEDKMASKPHADKVQAARVQSMKKLAERRSLSNYVRKRLIDSATTRSTTISAC